MKIKQFIQSIPIHARKHITDAYSLEDEHSIIPKEMIENADNTYSATFKEKPLTELTFGEGITIYNWNTNLEKIDWSIAKPSWINAYDFLGTNIFQYAIILNKWDEIPQEIKSKCNEYTFSNNVKKEIKNTYVNDKWDGLNLDFEYKKWCKKTFLDTVTKTKVNMQEHQEILSNLKKYNQPLFQKICSKIDKEFCNQKPTKKFHKLFEAYCVTIYTDKEVFALIKYFPNLYNHGLTSTFVNNKANDIYANFNNVFGANAVHLQLIPGRGIEADIIGMYSRFHQQLSKYAATEISNAIKQDLIDKNDKGKIEVVCIYLTKINDPGTWKDSMEIICSILNTNQLVELNKKLESKTSFYVQEEKTCKRIILELESLSKKYKELTNVYTKLKSMYKKAIKTKI